MGMLWKLAALLIAFSGTASARLHGFLAGKTGGLGLRFCVWGDLRS